MRYVFQQPTSEAQPLKRTPERDKRFAEYLRTELADAISSRHQQDQWILEDLRLYEAQPRQPVRNVPVEGMPAIEVPLAAITVDDLYARFFDVVFTPTPVLTCRATAEDDPEAVEDARVAQRFIEWGTANEWHAKHAGEHVFLDCVKLGWGVFYIGWRETVTKTSLRRVTDVGATVLPVPIENFFTRGGLAYEIQSTPWVGMRTWLTPGELAEYSAPAVPDAQRWNTEHAIPIGNIDWIRSKREALAGTFTNKAMAELYEVFTIHAYYDYDEDGFDENLLAIFDRTSGTFLWLGYNEQERRPYETCAFQLRAHTLGGMGVVRMLAPLQMEMTESHFDAMVNSKLANMRMWAGPPGLVAEGKNMRVWSGRYLAVPDGQPPQELKLSDVYPSTYRNEATLAALAQQRVGSDLSVPRPSQVLQSRTPATTALSFLEQGNRRFTPAFDSMRFAYSESVWQCLIRYRERLVAGDEAAANNIRRVLNEADSRRLIDLLTGDHFEDRVNIETTAASSSVNKEAERQNNLQLFQTLLTYYEKLLALAQVAYAPDVQGVPPVPPEVKALAKQIAEAGGEALKRLLRTYDQVRDVSTLVVELDDAIDQSVPAPDPAAMMGLMAMLGGMPGDMANGALGSPEPVALPLPEPQPVVL